MTYGESFSGFYMGRKNLDGRRKSCNCKISHQVQKYVMEQWKHIFIIYIYYLTPLIITFIII